MIKAIRQGYDVLNVAVIKKGEQITLSTGRVSAFSGSWDFDGGTGDTSAESPVVSWSTRGIKDITYTPSIGMAERVPGLVMVVDDYDAVDNSKKHYIQGNGSSMTVDGVRTTNSWINASSWEPGSTVYLSGDFFMSDRLAFLGLEGTEQDRIHIVNNGLVNISVDGGFENCMIFQGSKWVTVVGSSNPAFIHGFNLDRGVQAYGEGWGLEFFNMSISGQGIGGACGIGFQIKNANAPYEADKNRWWFSDTKIAGCLIEYTNEGGEGIYFGHFHNFNIGGLWPHYSENLYIWGNIINNTGRDAIQVGCVQNANVFRNLCYGSGKSLIPDHQNEIQINSGTGGKFYNNICYESGGTGGKISVFPDTDTDIFSNVFYCPSETFGGLFLRSIKNDAGAPRPNMDPFLNVNIFHNAIFASGPSITYYKDVQNIYSVNIKNNILVHGPGEPSIEWQNDQPTNLDVSDNIEDPGGAASDYFIDAANQNFDAPQNSPALGSGADLSPFWNSTIGLYDGNGLSIEGLYKGAFQYKDLTTGPAPTVGEGANPRTLMSTL
jgi:hypothetical protein